MQITQQSATAMRLIKAYVCMYLLVSLQVHSQRAVDCCIGPTMRGSCPYIDNLQLEDAVTLDLQGGVAVFNVKCAHAAEPFTNERCSVIGFTYVCSWPRETQRGKHTHTHTHTRTHPSCAYGARRRATINQRALALRDKIRI